MTTRAAAFLARNNIPFDVVKYDHQEKGAAFAARAIKFPLEKTVKTLVVETGRKAYRLVLMPGHKEIDLKRLARFYGAKRAAMADVQTAQRLTGYLVGGISPFGVKQALPAVMDASLATLDRVAINAGQRGVMLLMRPGDIIKVLDCDLIHFNASEKENS